MHSTLYFESNEVLLKKKKKKNFIYLFSDIWGNLEKLGPMRYYSSIMGRIIAAYAVIVKGEVRPL